jgi:hypothetical protein
MIPRFFESHIRVAAVVSMLLSGMQHLNSGDAEIACLTLVDGALRMIRQMSPENIAEVQRHSVEAHCSMDRTPTLR